MWLYSLVCVGPGLKNIGQKYNLELYGYADDHKIAFRIQVGDAQSETIVIKQLSECLQDIIVWMNQKKLKMNHSKTEIICMELSSSLPKLTSRV